MKRMKRLLALALCTLLSASIAACGGSGTQPAADAPSTTREAADEAATASGESVKISFMSHLYKPWNDKLTEQINNFEAANPGVTVEYSVVEHTDLNTKLMTSLSAGSPPTIMGIYGPWMADLTANNWLDEAPAYVVEDIEANTFDFAGESAKYGDKYYGYIQHIGIATPVINTDLYAAAGAEPPATYEELLQVNRDKLDIYDGDTLIQAGSAYPPKRDGSWNVIAWSTILQSYGGSIMDENNTAAFNTPVGVEATNVYAELTHPTFLDQSFSLGKSAMEYVGPFQRSFYEENCPDINYKALDPLAGPADTVAALYVWFWSVAADADAPQKEAAWRLLHEISNDENYLDMSNTAGFISFRVANYDDPAYASDEWIGSYRKALDVARIYYSKIPDWEKIDLVLGTELEKLTIGSQTAEETLANAEAEINRIIGA